jgi:hypothetical protein
VALGAKRDPIAKTTVVCGVLRTDESNIMLFCAMKHCIFPNPDEHKVEAGVAGDMSSAVMQNKVSDIFGASNLTGGVR